jgi:pilus assembly protein CpaB
MRSGGRVFLLLGVVIAAAAALGLYYVFSLPQTPQVDPSQILPTPVPKKVQVVFARIDLPADQLIDDIDQESSLIYLDEIPEDEYNAQPNKYFRSLSELRNKVVIRDIRATSPIFQENVRDGGLALEIPTAQPNQPRRKAIPYQVNTLTGVADQIQEGDYVDMVMTFEVKIFYLRPGLELDPETNEFRLTFKEDTYVDMSTKTLLQNVQVLKVLKQEVPPDATPTAVPSGAAPPTNPDGTIATGPAASGGVPEGDTFVPGNWLLILAVTDQEAELVRYSLERAKGISLVLRGRGDPAVEDTVGATLDILVSQYGLPLPQPFSIVPANPSDLTPTPTGI